MKKLFSIFLCFTVSFFIFAQEVMKPEILKKINDNVFEVVVKKVEDESIVYERDLPFDSIDFSIRNDKYIPIGTAFLLEDGLFYSAAHVFSIYEDSFHPDYYIRDVNQNVYKVENITALSTRRDFISFTVPEYTKKTGSGLKIQKKLEMNTNVFSVGNALGEGIIIRNGLLTSQTYETQDGEWKWLRFSAAASPGNSGGPLVDSNGNVLGIITMKSQNENLNYALPMEEMKKVPENIAQIKLKLKYKLPNIFNKSQNFDFNLELPLPMTYTSLHAKATAAYRQEINKTISTMRNQYNPEKEKGFSNAKEAEFFFFDSKTTSFPHTIFYSESNEWDFGYAMLSSKSLPDNGNIDYCEMLGYDCCLVTKPESVNIEQFLSDPDEYLKYVLDATKMCRYVGSESVPIKSFGKPSKSEKYVDYFGRTWLVNLYDIKFADSAYLSFALPLPTGVYVMSVAGSKEMVTTSNYLDMKFVADHVYTSYIGNYQQWKDFLALKKEIAGELPAFLKEITINQGENTGKDNSLNKSNFLTIETKKFKISIPENIIKTDDDTKICLSAIMEKKDKKVLVSINNVIVLTNSKKDNYTYISMKNLKKPSDKNKQLAGSFDQLANQTAPYNSEPYNYEKYTYLDCVSFPKGKDKNNADEVFLNCYELLGQNCFDEIKALAQEMKQYITIK
ncbi:MAG: trypsin-like peptidase domain-containing protein [Treponema sp.]|nr:trypsin-like peptidase domain-containing protein [Treponema sp.]